MVLFFWPRYKQQMIQSQFLHPRLRMEATTGLSNGKYILWGCQPY